MNNTKRIFSLLLAALFCFGASSAAMAIDAGAERVTIGADLDQTQRAVIYKDFGIVPGSVTELTVTNREERAYLEGLVSDQKIGSVALSCVYIKTLAAGSGLQITTNNINWCTREIYVNALTTAGITDAEVRVSAPFPVSGTAALTGIYKAYEDITGESLNDLAKVVAAEEMVITGNLTELLGSVDAATLVNELKLILEQTKNMSDEQVIEEIKAIAAHLNVSLTDGQIQQLLSLCRSMEKLNADELAAKVTSLTQTLETAGKAQQTFSKVVTDVKNFFVSIGTFFTNLFGGKK